MRYYHLIEKREMFDVRGRDVPVHVDPTAREIQRTLDGSKYGLLRGFAADGHLYIWDANLAIHDQIARQVTDQPFIRFMMSGDFETILEDSLREFSTADIAYFEDPFKGYFYVSSGEARDFIRDPVISDFFDLIPMKISEKEKKSKIYDFYG